LRAWSFCVVVYPALNGLAATSSRHPPSVLSRPNAVMGKYSQTRLCGGVSALQSRSNDPSDRVHQTFVVFELDPIRAADVCQETLTNTCILIESRFPSVVA
jgi:hypothetical protein